MFRLKVLFAAAIVLAIGLPTASALGKPHGPGHHAKPGGGGGSIDLIRPWGNAAYSGGHISVSYTISASNSVPASAVNAVQAGIDHWNSCFDGSNTFNETLGGTNFSTTDSGCSGLSFKGKWDFVSPTGGATPLVKISIKKGGGNIAGQTFDSFDRSGFIKSSRVQISGSAFGSANDAQTLWDVSTHELGHVVGLGHSDVSDDLMYPVINGTVSIGSCEINGAEALYESWLPSGSSPELPTQSSVSC